MPFLCSYRSKERLFQEDPVELRRYIYINGPVSWWRLSESQYNVERSKLKVYNFVSATHYAPFVILQSIIRTKPFATRIVG